MGLPVLVGFLFLTPALNIFIKRMILGCENVKVLEPDTDFTGL